MQSKTSYFNATLFKKNLTRFWPLWGGASLLGALAPLAILIRLLDEGFQNAPKPLEITNMYYYALAYVVPTVSLIYAVLCALAVWHYLYNARSVSLYHSLPITRKGLFCTNFLSGMFMMFIPYAVTGLLMVLITLAAGCFEPAGVLVTILGVAGDSFFFFASATLVVFVTGNPFACAAFYLIFHFFFAAAEYLAGVIATQFYFGVSQTYNGVLEFLSPVVFLTSQVRPYAETVPKMTSDGWYASVYQSVRLENGWIIGAYALAGVVLAGCAWLLYQRRRSESAGDVVAVGWMKPVFRYGVALCASPAGGVLLYNLFFDFLMEDYSTVKTMPMALCMAFSGVIGYYIASMLLAKSPKVFRGGSWKGALGTLLAAVVICVGIALDPAGVESWVPAMEDLDSVIISFYGPNGGGFNAELDDPASIQKIMDLHQAILDEKDLLSARDYNMGVYLTYYERDGSYATRFYDFPAIEEISSNALTMAKELVCDPAIQEANIFGFLAGRSARLTGGYVGQIYNTETQSPTSFDLTREEAQVLEDAVRRDIAAGHFGKTIFINDYEDYKAAAFYNQILLNYNITAPPSENSRNYGSTLNISMSVYCTETLQALEDLGIVDDTHRLLTRKENQELAKNGLYSSSTSDYYDGEYYYA